jgi:sugar O-acyltransferase (sialic acid O-acetyltransferase NeuD family)
MNKTIKIIMPKANVSDDYYTVVENLFNDGDKIKKGEAIILCEGSKTAFEIEAEESGFISYKKSIGDEVEVGEVIAEINPDALTSQEDNEKNKDSINLNISQKAAALAEKHDINLSIFSDKQMITVNDINKVIDRNNSLKSTTEFSEDDVAIIGSGGHAKQIYDSIKGTKKIAGLIVHSISEESFDDLSIIGTIDDLEKLRSRKLKRIIIGFGSLDNPKKRQILSNKLDSMGFRLESVIHKSAIIESSATIEDGAQIFAGAIIGSRAKIEKNAIVNSGAVVSHDSHIKTNAHITPGAILAGSVEIGENSIIGMGSTIYIGVKVGSNLVVNNGTHISKDLH